MLPARARTPNALRFLLALAVVAVVLERAHALVRAGPTDFDDAYMYLRYAHNALAGHWLAWNPGEAPVYGVTSLLHFLLVTLASGLLPSHPAAALQIASGVAALVLLAALVTVCARFSQEVRLRGNFPLWGAVLLPLLCFREAFFFHAHTGMDTMLAALANTFVVFASLRLGEKPSPTRALVAAGVGLLAIEARPDNVIIAALCPFLALLLLAPAPRLRPLMIWAGTLAGLVLIDLTLKWHFLGTPLPLAFYAKQPWYYRGFVGEFTWNPFWFLKAGRAAAACDGHAGLTVFRQPDHGPFGTLLLPLAAALRGGGCAGHRPVGEGAAQSAFIDQERASACAIDVGSTGLRIVRASGRRPGSASRRARL